MLQAVNLLFTTIFTDIMPVWLALDSIQYLIGVIIFALIMSVIINFIKRR